MVLSRSRAPLFPSSPKDNGIASLAILPIQKGMCGLSFPHSPTMSKGEKTVYSHSPSFSPPFFSGALPCRPACLLGRLSSRGRVAPACSAGRRRRRVIDLARRRCGSRPEKADRGSKKGPDARLHFARKKWMHRVGLD